jgi:hypothetical protein
MSFLYTSLPYNPVHDTQELINRVNRNSEECGIDIAEELMLYCMSPLLYYLSLS